MSSPETVELTAYSPLWPAVFALERDRLVEHFAGEVIEIAHIGSTAVPGLGAKPIIDVMLGAENLQVVEQRIEALAADGYRYVKEFEMSIPDRRYFDKREGNPGRFHLHAVVRGAEFWLRHLRFRDALRSDPALAERYWKIKQSLAARHRGDRGAYAEGKTDFIRGVLQGASRK